MTSERANDQEYKDDVPEILPAEKNRVSALADVPVDTQLKLPEDGSPKDGLYVTHTPSRLYGTAKTIQVIMKVGNEWAQKHPGSAVGIGDISKKGGGTISGHASHKRGIDFDVRLMRKDQALKYVTIHDSQYSRALTKELIDFFVHNGISRVIHIFFNDPALRKPPVQPWPNHDNHFHVRLELN